MESEYKPTGATIASNEILADRFINDYSPNMAALIASYRSTTALEVPSNNPVTTIMDDDTIDDCLTPYENQMEKRLLQYWNRKESWKVLRWKIA